jgi:hypothetical protein
MPRGVGGQESVVGSPLGSDRPPVTDGPQRIVSRNGFSFLAREGCRSLRRALLSI